MEIEIMTDVFEKHDLKGALEGFIEKKSITLYTKEDIEEGDIYWDYNKQDIPFLTFQEFDIEGSEAVGECLMKEVFRIKITPEQAKQAKQFMDDGN